MKSGIVVETCYYNYERMELVLLLANEDEIRIPIYDFLKIEEFESESED